MADLHPCGMWLHLGPSIGLSTWARRSGEASTAPTSGYRLRVSTLGTMAERGQPEQRSKRMSGPETNLSVLMTRAAIAELIRDCFGGGSCVRELSRPGKQVLEGGFRLNALQRRDERRLHLRSDLGSQGFADCNRSHLLPDPSALDCCNRVCSAKDRPAVRSNQKLCHD